MKTLSYSLIVENESILTPESKERLTSYYKENKQIPSPVAVTKTCNRIFGSVPPTVELSIKKDKVLILLFSDWGCTVIGRSLKRCIASFTGFHEEIYLQLHKPIVCHFQQDESIQDLVAKDRRQRIMKILVVVVLGVFVSEALRRLVITLLQFLRVK